MAGLGGTSLTVTVFGSACSQHVAGLQDGRVGGPSLVPGGLAVQLSDGG